ncbi:MAG: hypothetical protein M1817_002826 [Caeruleum heppii]|nr:MAG: hypothetical protein M1817_002826 [Caeruleum heppii]
MIPTLVSTVALLLRVTEAAQPSAPEPVPAPLRELPWGQLNFLHTTDTHGWHAGHLQESSYSADWGDYISLTERFKQRADELGVDLLVVDTGDRVEGNGLYDASSPKGNYTSDIFKQQHIDIICAGNHELYRKHTADREYLTTVPNFRDSYLASNLDILVPTTGERVPLAPRFRKFTTKNQGIHVLAFGFLFDFSGNYNNTIVQPVEATIKEPWFQEAIRDQEVDVFVVAGHVPVRSKEFTDIFRAIREVRWDTPIQFLGGHTHIRDYTKFDAKAYALESGRYMETIGFASVDGLAKSKNRVHSLASPTFGRRYLDNNLFSFHHHTGLNESSFPTSKGREVSQNITHARKALELDTLHGCAPQDYWLSRARYPGKHSIFTWLEEQVIPDMLNNDTVTNTARLVIANTGTMRFDIFKGPFTRDTTFIVSPFEGGFRQIKGVSYAKAKQILPLLNSDGPVLAQLPASELSPPQQHWSRAELNADEGLVGLYDQQVLSENTEKRPDLPPGYTTKDDLGNDGDDTAHSALSFYRVPNCIQRELGFTSTADTPETVDLVFLEFIEPWIILALKFLGGELNVDDISDYAMGRSFTSMIAEWVKEHWSQHC